MNDREIVLEGVRNFRDIGGDEVPGGRQTLPGLIYRSARLTKLTDRDRETLHALRIATVFDLRMDDEIERDGLDRVGPEIKVIHTPITLIQGNVLAEIKRKGDDFHLVEHYLSSLDFYITFHADLLHQIVEHLDQPLVIHCSAGKDRTGVVVALLLRLARVSEQDIIDDYALTSVLMANEFVQERKMLQQAMGLIDHGLDELFGAAPATMQAMLHAIDINFGSVEGYLKQGGATTALIEQFRAAFVVEGVVPGPNTSTAMMAIPTNTCPRRIVRPRDRIAESRSLFGGKVKKVAGATDG